MFLAVCSLLSLCECVAGQTRIVSQVGKRAFSGIVLRDGLRSITQVEAFLDHWAGLLQVMQTDVYIILGRRLRSGTVQFSDDLLPRTSESIPSQKRDFLVGKQWLTEKLAQHPGAVRQAGALVLARFNFLKNLHLQIVPQANLGSVEFLT